MKMLFANNGHIFGCNCAGTYASSLCVCTCEIRCLSHAFVASLIGTIVEFIGANHGHSGSLWADAVHLSTDTLSVAVLIFFYFYSRRRTENKRLKNIIEGIVIFLLFLAAGFVFYEGIERFVNPQFIDGKLTLLIAGIGLASNIYSHSLLKKSHAGKHAEKATEITIDHFLADIATSFIVIIAMICLVFFGQHIGRYVDFAGTMVIGLWMAWIGIQALRGEKHTHSH